MSLDFDANMPSLVNILRGQTNWKIESPTRMAAVKDQMYILEGYQKISLFESKLNNAFNTGFSRNCSIHKNAVSNLFCSQCFQSC